ncbi:MAG TPA: O-methyltransferase [Bacteroidales bacterium]|nr:O-methyltransferase [Bacteroidales bacterium]HOK99052.1 O-methyltransferase [Bacteroidales bacterium]HPO65896.1 O-methyltransferase [Bacteroidales bacterium]
MNIDLETYIEEHCSEELPILRKIYRETHIKYLNPRMVCGHIQGMFLSLLSKMIQPEVILEIGTFTGYSAICLAQGLKPEGTLYTIEVNEEIVEVAQQYIAESEYSKLIQVIHGNAIEVVPQLSTSFDLIYIDGEKAEYPEYLEVCLPHLKVGGYLIADNVLWDGKILNTEAQDKATQALRKFNDAIKNNPSLEKVLLPLRDGLFLCRKIL